MVLPGKGMSWKEFAVSLKKEWSHDRVGDVAGALTFFGVLAIFPFLIFLVSLASVIIDPKLANELIRQLSEVAPPQVTEILAGQLRSLGESNNVGLLTFGAVGAIWAASGGMVALMRALNAIYGVEEGRPFWKVRGIAIGMTLLAAVTGIIAVLVAVFLPPLAERVGGPIGEAVLWLRMPVAGLLMMFVWAVLYWVLPDVEQRFKFITPGSVVGVLLWVLASWGFSLYVQNFGKYEATYGALGGVVVLLFWMWISSQVLLLGAEINAVIEHRSPDGKVAGGKTMDETGPSGTKLEEQASEDAQRLPAPSAVGPAVAVTDKPRPKVSWVWSLAALAAGGWLAHRRERRA